MLDRATALAAIGRMCASCQGAGAHQPVLKVREAIETCTMADCPLFAVRMAALLEPPAPAIDPARLARWYANHHRVAA